MPKHPFGWGAAPWPPRSAPTLEAVVDYFNSDAYNRSPDGKKQPIHLNVNERNALLAFLRIL